MQILMQKDPLNPSHY